MAFNTLSGPRCSRENQIAGSYPKVERDQHDSWSFVRGDSHVMRLDTVVQVRDDEDEVAQDCLQHVEQRERQAPSTAGQHSHGDRPENPGLHQQHDPRLLAIEQVARDHCTQRFGIRPQGDPAEHLPCQIKGPQSCEKSEYSQVDRPSRISSAHTKRLATGIAEHQPYFRVALFLCESPASISLAGCWRKPWFTPRSHNPTQHPEI